MIRFNSIDFKLGGTISGERNIEAIGSLVYEDLKTGIKAFVSLSTFKKGGYFTGKATGSLDGLNGIIY